MGRIAKPDFVGWSGLFPISILYEYVFLINVDFTLKIFWNDNEETIEIKALNFGRN